MLLRPPPQTEEQLTGHTDLDLYSEPYSNQPCFSLYFTWFSHRVYTFTFSEQNYCLDMLYFHCSVHA